MRIRSAIGVIVVLVCLSNIFPADVGASCGDGVLDPTEICDDGNLVAWDGCSPSCTYEFVQRLNALALSGGTGPDECTPGTNAFGGAFSTLAREGLNANLQSALDDGSLDVVMVILGLDDPTGADDPSLEIALVPSTPDPGDGSLGLDSLHWGDADAFDASGRPVDAVDGALALGDLVAGPEDLIVPASDTDDFVLDDGFLVASIGMATSTPAPPPQTIAPGFSTFETLEGLTPTGGLCGNITVGSLAMVPIPEDFGAGGTTECRSACAGSRNYTACGETGIPGVDCNSLLDIMVSGCATTVLCLRLVQPTQPDVGAGGATPHVLVADPTTGFVTVTEPADAYSTAFDFAAVRAHLTHGPILFIDGFESGTVGAWSN